MEIGALTVPLGGEPIEDAVASPDDRGVDVLDRAVFETEPGDAYWAE
ncbi:hypothetical protein DM2_546 [Halorubrum sp. DM2]|nr:MULTISPECIES: hypothetical protein [unclassified Halorubrum]CDK38696.1 hypothetical protein BN903_370 [Halorubrum sp. AJ67]VTT85664.1 hypothetical protein DM2_546 [Halorubrum sp. DM2]